MLNFLVFLIYNYKKPENKPKNILLLLLSALIKYASSGAEQVNNASKFLKSLAQGGPS